MRARQPALQVDLELAVVRAPGIVGLLGAADALRDDADERQLEERVGDESADALGFGDRRPGHSRHVQREVSLLQLGQKAGAEERHRRAADEREEKCSGEGGARMRDDLRQHRFVAAAQPARDRRIVPRRESSAALGFFGNSSMHRAGVTIIATASEARMAST